LWLLLASVLIPCAHALPVQSASDESPQPATREPSQALRDQVIILNNAADLEALLRKLRQPDVILIRPDPSGASGMDRSSSPTTTKSPTHVYNSVRISGRIENELAELSLELELETLASGSVWVPIGIESPIITSAREGDRELRLRKGAKGVWEANLGSAGKHRLQLSFNAPIKANGDRKSLAVAIPAAPATYLELDIPRPIYEVDLGTGEAIGKTPLSSGKGSRLSAYLFPRSKLNLSWTEEAQTGAPPTPLLTAQVEMAIDADAEAITTRSAWVIRCVRGVARRIEIRLDEQDVVTKSQLDDQFLVPSIERNILTIPLGEQLRAGETRRLTLETRRSLSPSSSRVFTFSGFPLANAVEQFGAIGVTQSANLWVSVNTARDLRRIDPRDLPTRLSARPGTSLAFQFLDQPFNLELAVEKSPPLYRSDSRTQLSMESDTVHVRTDLEIQKVRGQLFEIEALVPAGLQLLSVGPPELVESANPIPEPTPPTQTGPTKSPSHVLRIHLTPQGRDQKNLRISLSGRERIPSEGPVAIGFFGPRDGVSTTSTISLLAERDVTFEMEEGALPGAGSSQPVFKRLNPVDRSASGGFVQRVSPVLEVRSSQNPVYLRGRLRRHERTISHETRMVARVNRRAVDVRQETRLQVQYGVISTLTIRVPFPRPDLWQVQAKEAVRREELRREADGMHRYRLTFDPPIVGTETLAFLYQFPLERPLTSGNAVESGFRGILIEEGTPASTTVELTAESGIKVSASDEAWTSVSTTEEEAADGAAPREFHTSLTEGRPPRFAFTARMVEQVPVPTLVAPRVLLRTFVGHDSQSRTHAWYWIETQESYFSFQLPEGSRWIRSRIDGQIADRLEVDASGSGCRINLPSGAQSKAVLVEIEYQSIGPQRQVGWDPPRLQDGAEVMQVLWEFQVPWNQAILGVPDGWNDDNEWYWDFYVWKRRPWRSFTRLVEWVSGTSGGTAASLESALSDEQGDTHSYLFGRAGHPVPIRLWVISRAWIVAVCSGSVLAVGFLLLFSRLSFRLLWLGISILALVAASFAHPSTLLVVVQSAVSGFVLVFLGLMIQRVIERPRTAAPGPSTAGVLPGQVSQASSPGGSPGVGSDDSTAVRVRVSSTMDYVPAPMTVAPDPESSRGTGVGRSG
jgi:hypothetical protein